MTKRKCKWCKEYGVMDEMVCYSQETDKLNASGSKILRRSYAHVACDEIKKDEILFKEREAEELDELYRYLLKLHNVELLDGRMFMKIQDLRNGTISLNGKKIKKSKEGVTFKQMLHTYEHVSKNIDNVIRSKHFKTKWNEFSYVFGIMINNMNEVKSMQKRNETVIVPTKIVSEDFNLQIARKQHNKKDSMDISDFL